MQRITRESTRNELADVETPKKETGWDGIARSFVQDLKENAIEANGWPQMMPAYSISKAMLNAYTRMLAKKYQTMCINCVHPGFVATDLNWHRGPMTVERGG